MVYVQTETALRKVLEVHTWLRTDSRTGLRTYSVCSSMNYSLKCQVLLNMLNNDLKMIPMCVLCHCCQSDVSVQKFLVILIPNR